MKTQKEWTVVLTFAAHESHSVLAARETFDSKAEAICQAELWFLYGYSPKPGTFYRVLAVRVE